MEITENNELIQELNNEIQQLEKRLFCLNQQKHNLLNVQNIDTAFIVETIKSEVLKMFNITNFHVKSRESIYVEARMCINYILYSYRYKLGFKSISEIGKSIGMLGNHATCLNAVKRAESLMFSDQKVREDIKNLTIFVETLLSIK